MKKISKPNGDIRLEGTALIDGVSIQASRKNLKGTFEKMPIRTVARVNDDESIYFDMVKKLEFDKNTQKIIDQLKAKKRQIQKYGLIAAIIMFLISFAMIYVDIDIANFCTGIMYLLWGVAGSSANLAYFFYKLKKDGDVLSLMRFHSAEHAVINGYYDLQRLPTLDEIKRYSSYSRACGSLEQSFNLVLFGSLAIVRFLTTGLLFVPVAIFVVILVIVLYKSNMLYFTEFMILDEPSDLEYNVAIKALDVELTNIGFFECEQKKIAE